VKNSVNTTTGQATRIDVSNVLAFGATSNPNPASGPNPAPEPGTLSLLLVSPCLRGRRLSPPENGMTSVKTCPYGKTMKPQPSARRFNERSDTRWRASPCRSPYRQAAMCNFRTRRQAASAPVRLSLLSRCPQLSPGSIRTWPAGLEGENP
jgi:hypothetical protein